MVHRWLAVFDIIQCSFVYFFAFDVFVCLKRLKRSSIIWLNSPPTCVACVASHVSCPCIFNSLWEADEVGVLAKGVWRAKRPAEEYRRIAIYICRVW